MGTLFDYPRLQTWVSSLQHEESECGLNSVNWKDDQISRRTRKLEVKGQSSRERNLHKKHSCYSYAEAAPSEFNRVFIHQWTCVKKLPEAK